MTDEDDSLRPLTGRNTLLDGGPGQGFELKFAMPLRLKASLRDSPDSWERNAFASWKNELQGQTVYLLGWCDGAFSVVKRLGDYHCINISGHPSYLFEPDQDG